MLGAELFQLVTDSPERLNRASETPEKVAELRLLVENPVQETKNRNHRERIFSQIQIKFL